MAAHHNPDTVKHIADGLSIATVLGTLVEVLPALAALISIIWGCIRIYETDTVQRLLGRAEKGGANDTTR